MPPSKETFLQFARFFEKKIPKLTHPPPPPKKKPVFGKNRNFDLKEP